MLNGRREVFDVVCMHRDDVTRAPDGAVVTATNDHTEIQAFAYESGDVSFWGVQYHPECTLEDAAFWLSRPGPAWSEAEAARAAALKRIAAEPMYNGDLAVKLGVTLDLLDPDYHRTELRNWLKVKVGAM